MLLAESTVDAEAAQSVDCSKVLVNGSCNLGVDFAVMVVEAANCLVGGHEGLDGLCELVLKSINLLNCGSSVCHLAFESLNDFLCVAHAIPFPRVFYLKYRPVRTRFSLTTRR